MKTRICLGFAAFFLSFSLWAGTNTVTIPALHYRLVAGQVNLPSGLGTPRYTVYLGLYSYYPFWNAYTYNVGSWTPYPPAVNPGFGYIIRTFATNMTFSLADPPSQSLPLQLPAGFSLVCCQSNVPATYDMIVGRAPVEGAQIYKFKLLDTANPTMLDETNYTIYTFANGSWTPEAPIADIGEAVWVFLPPAMSNLQMTTNQFSFDALTPFGGSMDVEYSDSLSGPWLVLTNLSGFGGVTNVLDPSNMSAQTQRFYRLKLLQN
jgi:hypothetical protein